MDSGRVNSRGRFQTRPYIMECRGGFQTCSSVPLLLAFLFIAGCASSTNRQRTGLYATLEAEPESVRSLDRVAVMATVRNNGPSDTTVNRYVLNNPTLSLEVRDAAGAPIPLLPPPIPPVDLRDYDTLLHAGTSLRFLHHLPVGISVSSGSYTIRMRSMASDTVTVTVE